MGIETNCCFSRLEYWSSITKKRPRAFKRAPNGLVLTITIKLLGKLQNFIHADQVITNNDLE